MPQRVRPAGYDVRLVDPDGADADEGEIVLSLDPPPLGLMQGYLQEDGTLRPVEGALYLAPATLWCRTRTGR